MIIKFFIKEVTVGDVFLEILLYILSSLDNGRTIQAEEVQSGLQDHGKQAGRRGFFHRKTDPDK
jgi:hypothetical protein